MLTKVFIECNPRNSLFNDCSPQEAKEMKAMYDQTAEAKALSRIFQYLLNVTVWGEHIEFDDCHFRVGDTLRVAPICGGCIYEKFKSAQGNISTKQLIDVVRRQTEVLSSATAPTTPDCGR
jgi:hypothetical protein